MELAFSAARWVVGKALSPITDGVLEAWAASEGLGVNMGELKMELLYAQAMLNNTRGREIDNPALNVLLQKLRELAYDADDVLDELDYFRIQDELDGTYHAADEHAGGCLRNHALNARHTSRGIGKMLGFSSSSHSASRGNSDEPSEDTRCVLCGAWPCRGHGSLDHDDQEDEANRAVLCGVWPCRRASTPKPTQPRLLSTDKADTDLEEVHSGCMQQLASAARNTINIVGKHIPCNFVPSPVQNDADSNMPPQREHAVKAPKLKFDRVEMSKKIKEITEQLKPVCAKVSTILNLELLDSNRSIAQHIAISLDTMLPNNQDRRPLLTHSAAISRPMTTAELTEPEIYGRNDEINKIKKDITQGDYCDKDLTVLPIVGPGGIGKTTLTQVIYKELEHHFKEKFWVCVSTTFSVYKLRQEIMDIMKLNKTDSPEKLIEEKLKSKKFLLVLDDMWSCSDDDWKRFLVPFSKGQTKGSIVLVTTRFPAVAHMVKTTESWIDLKSIDSEAFKDLFIAYVFGDKKSSDDHSGLLDIGFRIIEKLKGSPLAAKTVGRLLKKHLDLNHWNRVLESKEWEFENGENDIMPALKLSYDYLPFHLQHCFSYCALFPEDYKFKAEELIHLWIGLDVLHSHGGNRRIEDIGLNHLIELVNSGFFRKEEDGKLPCYVIHDLLHELASKISSHECLSINSANVGSAQIPASIRYLSVNIDDTSVKDKLTFDTCQKDLSTLVKRLKVGSLRSIMFFGQYQGNFVKTVAGLLKEAKALRVIFLSDARYNFKDLLQNFPYCVHLCYLRIKYFYERIVLPNIISRFYHLRVLDLQTCYNIQPYSAKDMCNLVKLRHFLVGDGEMHSSICEVGKLTSLQELMRFVLKKESEGFELNQIGHLTGLCGSLNIEGLERIELMEEADGAKLIQKTHLHELILHWGIGRSNKESGREQHVLESLKPSTNLVKLCIRGHGGFTCPSWLGANLSVENLESLHLDDVPWVNLPPIGELWMVNEHGEEHLGCVPHNMFLNLRRLELNKLPGLKKWAESDPCHMFSHLEVLIITHCSELTELSFSHSTCCQQQKEAKINWFPRLRELNIEDCPKLLSFSPVPWTRAPCSAKIEGVGSGLEKLVCEEDYKSEYSLEIKMKDALASELWNVLAFDNLTEIKELKMDTCPPLPQHHLQMLSSLKTLQLYGGSSIVFPLVEGERHAESQSPVECIYVIGWGASAKELTQLLACFPKLSELHVWSCEKITGLAVVEKQETQTLMLAPSDNRVDGDAEIEKHPQQDGTRGEEEIAASSAEGLLVLPSQLQKLAIASCPELSLQCSPVDHNREAGRTGGGEGLQGLRSLRWLRIYDCPGFLSSYSSSSSSSCPPFPSSLEGLSLEGALGMSAPLPLSNLTSLTDLSIDGCGDLRVEGLRYLLAQGRLTKLTAYQTPNFFASPEPLLPHKEEFPSSSSKLQELGTDDVASVLAAPICTLLSSSLTELSFWRDEEVERFTKEQDDALQLLISLEEIRFSWCDKLQCPPAGLRGLPNLKRLNIFDCPAIRSLPKDGLPSSLQELEIDDCPAIQSLPKDCLPTSLQKLRIESCPAIRSLSKDSLPSSLQKLEIYDCPTIRPLPKVNDLPSSLRELDVRDSGNDELRRQCRKLIGIIPVVYT